MKNYCPTEFMGFNNVIDLEPILSENGKVTDGFKVYHKNYKPVKISKTKTIQKEVITVDTVYIRDYDYDSKKPDGSIHGFGNPNYYLNVCSAEKAARKEQAHKMKVNSNVNLEFINKSIK